jgi:hypothetical protein
MDPVAFAAWLGTQTTSRLLERVDQSRIEDRRGEPSREVENDLLKAWSKHPIQREKVRRDVAERRAELAGDNPTIIEILLADRVAICWLDALVADRESRTGIAIEMLEVSENDYYQRRAAWAQRRFITALRALGQVRKLALPTLLEFMNYETKKKKKVGQVVLHRRGCST